MGMGKFIEASIVLYACALLCVGCRGIIRTARQIRDVQTRETAQITAEEVIAKKETWFRGLVREEAGMLVTNTVPPMIHKGISVRVPGEIKKAIGDVAIRGVMWVGGIAGTILTSIFGGIKLKQLWDVRSEKQL